ncbi:MAG: hypothetical protein HQK56_19505 [Deltaproteobacteria bacterium]|nr:hypothetical protein [Deltaproteobacteria bacterium]
MKKMQARTIEHVKGSELPAAWLEQFGFYPDQTFTITLEDEDEHMPPEEAFRPEFVEAVKQSEASYQAGRFVRCRTDEEIHDLFQRIKDE